MQAIIAYNVCVFFDISIQFDYALSEKKIKKFIGCLGQFL